MFTQDFQKDFKYLKERVFIDKKPTAFVRYADGETAIMLGKHIKGIDNWETPNLKTILSKDLIQSLKNNDKDWLIGISCKCCDVQTKNILLTNLTQYAQVNLANITFSNIFVNGNYSETINILKNISEEVVIIANNEGLDKKYPFAVKHFLPIDEKAVNSWEIEKNNIFLEINKLTIYNNTLFLISAGPLSEVIIDFLWKINKSNRYIDIGSALDEYTKGKKTRSYMKIGEAYSNQICKF